MARWADAEEIRYAVVFVDEEYNELILDPTRSYSVLSVYVDRSLVHGDVVTFRYMVREIP